MKTNIQKFALAYTALFLSVVALNYVPSIHDAQGLMFGLFKLDPIDDYLHLGSAIWAFVAGLASAGAALFYFRWSGLAYFLDGVLGVIAGKAYLDLAIFGNGPAIADFMTRIEANIPHIVIGGVAMLLARTYALKRRR